MPTHCETRRLPYTAQQMYDLVADVARYPEFLPWTAAARIRSVTEEGERQVMFADLVISFKVFRERFGSRVTLYPGEKKIDTEYLDGPFHHMVSNWAPYSSNTHNCLLLQQATYLIFPFLIILTGNLTSLLLLDQLIRG